MTEQKCGPTAPHCGLAVQPSPHNPSQLHTCVQQPRQQGGRHHARHHQAAHGAQRHARQRDLQEPKVVPHKPATCGQGGGTSE